MHWLNKSKAGINAAVSSLFICTHPTPHFYHNPLSIAKLVHVEQFWGKPPRGFLETVDIDTTAHCVRLTPPIIPFYFFSSKSHTRGVLSALCHVYQGGPQARVAREQDLRPGIVQQPRGLQGGENFQDFTGLKFWVKKIPLM